MTRQRLIATLVFGLLLGGTLAGQDSLSGQVLRLLTRNNSWAGTQTFLDLRMVRSVPSITLDRLYEDGSGNLYFNGVLVAGTGGVTNPHNLLSTTHPDTLPSAAVRGGVVVANSTPAWAQLALGSSGAFLRSNGTDAVWGTDGSALTNLPAANLTGTLPAISGVNLTALNASNLGSGTVPLARLSGITTSQLSASAAIVYSQLTLTGGIVNADVSSSAAIAYSKLNLGSSILTSDIAASTILFSNWASNSCTVGQVPQFNGSAWICRALQSSDVAGVGTVSSVALSLPGIFALTGSPITTSGTLAATLATQTANQVWAGPSAGVAAGPTFRTLVNADLPVTGVGAGTYAKVTVNTAGVVTVGATQATLTTDVTGVLPRANGGTGVSVSGNNSVLVGNGTVWAPQTVPDCQGGALAYTQSTNTFSCVTSGGPAHNILSATHGDTVVASVVLGDLITGNATPKWTRLGVGTVGQLLGVSAGTPTWLNTVARGSIAVSTPWTWTQTWNAAGVTFSGWIQNITDTASQAASLFEDFQVAGVSKYNVSKGGAITMASGITAGSGVVGIVGTDGRIPAISSTYFASLSGANLTALTATQLSGNVPVANMGNGSTTQITTTVTGTQNNFAPALAGDTQITVNNASDVTFTGMTGCTISGQQVTFVSIGSGNVFFTHQDAGSTAGNRFINFATTGTTPLNQGVARFTCDATASRWRMIYHQQGAWINPVFNAGDYTAATGTWTVIAGNVAVFGYFLQGRTMHIKMEVNSTSVSATPATLNRTIPGGFTSAVGTVQLGRVVDNGGAAAIGIGRVVGGTTMNFSSTINFTGWATSTTSTAVTFGEFIFDVQ